MPSSPASTPSTTLSSAGEREQVASSRAAGPQQRQLLRVPLDRPERGQVGEREPDQRARKREHDVQRVGIERVAGGGVQRVGQVVDELHLPGQRALRPS